MERASRVIGKLSIPSDTISAEELARAAWPLVVGKKVAGHTRAARMVRSRLIVEVEDAVWQRQLFALTGQILANLAKNLGRGLVEEIEFRVVPMRRGPQRAAEITAAGVSDEADQIADPVLRSLYKRARKRALA